MFTYCFVRSGREIHRASHLALLATFFKTLLADGGCTRGLEGRGRRNGTRRPRLRHTIVTCLSQSITDIGGRYRARRHGLSPRQNRLSADRPTTSTRARLFYWSAFGLAILLFAWLLDTSQISAALALLSSRGPSILWALLPYLAIVALETAAWKTILGCLDQPVPFGRLLHVRLAIEAVARAIPGGTIAAEGLKLYLLNTYCAVPLGQAAVSLSVLKILLVTTQTLYVAGGLGLLASRGLDTVNGRTTLLSTGAIAICLMLAVALGAFLVRGSAAQTFHRLLMRWIQQCNIVRGRVRVSQKDKRNLLDCDERILANHS